MSVCKCQKLKQHVKKQIKIAVDLEGLEEEIKSYKVKNVSNKIIKILFSKYDFD